MHDPNRKEIIRFISMLYFVVGLTVLKYRRRCGFIFNNKVKDVVYWSDYDSENSKYFCKF